METDVQGAAGRVDAPRHLWIVGGLAVLWNAIGAFDYLATQMEWAFYMGQFSETELDYFYGFPAWAVAGWAAAVWAGLAGAVGLLLRRRWAVGAFVVSLVGMAVSTLYSFGMSEGAAVMGTGGVIFSVVVAAVAVFLLLYARRMAARGVLGGSAPQGDPGP